MKQTKKKHQKTNNKKVITKENKFVIPERFKPKVILFLRILAVVGLIIYTDYLNKEFLYYKKVIKYQKPIIYDIVKPSTSHKNGYYLDINYKNNFYRKLSIDSEEYYDYVNNSIQPKLFYDKKNEEIISRIKIGATNLRIITNYLLIFLIALPYKLTVLLIMKIKPIHNYIKETEPIMYGFYLDIQNDIKKKLQIRKTQLSHTISRIIG